MRRFATGLVGAIVEARAELRIHRTRVLLSLIGVGVAVAALTTVVGIGAIAQRATTETFERSGGRAATLGLFAYQSSGDPLDPRAVQTAVDTTAERYGIEWYTSIGNVQQSVQFADGTQPVQVQLVDVEYQTIHRLEVLQGEWFGDRDVDRLAPGLVVNAAFMERLGSPDIRTHPTVTIAGDTPTTAVVLGVIGDRFPDEPATMTMLTPTWQRLADPLTLAQTVPGYEFWVPEETASELQDAIARDIPAQLGEGVQADIYRQDASAALGGEDPLLPYRVVLIGVAVLILFLGALSLVNISLVTVRQRIREIGIRRSFGATAGRVFFAVMMESVVGTLAAGVVGVFIAVAVVGNRDLQGLVAPGLTDLPPFPIEAALIGLAASVAVGAIAGLLPALVAVRVKVIDAIRY